MQVTLVKTTETLDVVRKLEDGTVEEVGSYAVSIADPGFVAEAEALVSEIRREGYDAERDYGGLTDRCVGLLRKAFADPAQVDEALGGRPDMYNAMLLLTAVMSVVNALDPGARLVESLNSFLPEPEQLSAEMLASRA